ncbi:MAG: hypothetical protein IH936_16225 [Acidobacteria bacterium]|nr:hypothetical protein [Acidobacteriota bacterium]
MGESRSHKTTANRLARRLGTDYHSDKGVDIVTDSVAIEVETEGNVSDGIRQLQGHKKPVYIAGANQATVEEALEKTTGTTVGVMDSQGNIVKPSARQKRWR